MKTENWGTVYWKFFHLFSLLYPTEPTDIDKKNGFEFINNIYNIIVCQKCANHFLQNLKKINILEYLDTKDNYILFFINLHNIVNNSLGKKTLSYIQSLDKINSFQTENNIIYYYNILLNFVKNKQNANDFFNNANYFFEKNNIIINNIFIPKKLPTKKPLTKKIYIETREIKKSPIVKPIIRKSLNIKSSIKKPPVSNPVIKKSPNPKPKINKIPNVKPEIKKLQNPKPTNNKLPVIKQVDIKYTKTNNLLYKKIK